MRHFVKYLCYNWAMKKQELTPFAVWLLAQLKKHNESPRAASLNAGIGHGQISRYLSGNRPSADSCIRLAIYFRWSPVHVLTLAGYDLQIPDYDATVDRIARLIKPWPESRKQSLIEAAEGLDRGFQGG